MKKIVLTVFLFIYNSAVAAIVIPDYSMHSYNQDILKLYSTVKNGSLIPRITEFSSAFLNKPYLDGALGEGKNGQFDQGPPYRSDAFDCVTYVSTVLALALSHNLNEFQHNISRINYRTNAITFENRNHFMSVDWNKVNQQHGYIKDITNTILDENGAPIATVATTVIDKPSWFRKLSSQRLHLLRNITAQQEQQLLQQLHDLAVTVKAKPAAMPYLPLNKLFTNGESNLKLFAQIPSGSIIEIVRPNWDLTSAIGTHILVSHLGFAIRTSKGLMYREASLLEKKVVDVPLESYLKSYLDSPTIKGINVQYPINKADEN